MQIILDGKSLTIEQVVRVAREGAQVEIAADAAARIDRASAFVEEKLRQGSVIYGITTGFGKFSSTLVSPDQAEPLQHNLIISHACAMGEPLSTEVVRAMMLLRLNTLCRGHSGIRRSTLETLAAMLNCGVHPIIPQQGSLGASGDLAPLAHMALVLIGRGEAEYRGERMDGAEAMNMAEIPPVHLAAKEGLALINGTQMMTAIGCLTLFDAMDLLKTADIAAAMACEAQLGITSAYHPGVHALRGHPGQQICATNLRALLAGSRLALHSRPDKVQDAYTIRCVPQIHGASRDAAAYAWRAVECEINAVTDNPILFPETDEVISGGNFHGQPIAFAMDFLCIALSEIANVSERRIERMVNPQLSYDLPAFLVREGGMNSGFMIAQFAAASIVSENKVLSHPASVDSITSSANQEDHVSMGATSARKAATILQNARRVLAIELFVAAQALSFRGEANLSPATAAVYARIRREIPVIETDSVMYPMMHAAERLLIGHEVTRAAETVCPNLQ